MTCRSFKETGKCTRGKDCWFAQTTPNHPRHWLRTGGPAASAERLIGLILLRMIFLAFLARRARRCPRRSNRMRGGRNVSTDPVSLGAIACPAPLIRGLPGQKQAGPHFPKALINISGGVEKHPSSGEPLHERRGQ
eukprot:3338205-Pyramimonas_sp.AAC.1